MEIGIVKWFNSERGFGKLARKDGDDLFVHISNVKGNLPLAEGAHVEFSVGAGRKGPEARDVRVIRASQTSLATTGASRKGHNPSDSATPSHSSNEQTLPYYFFERHATKRTLTQFHSLLEQDHFDVAFQVRWTAETDLALNPCKTLEPLPAPQYQGHEVGGIANRWLMIDRRLAISPFTVKSAVANGIANLLGGCCRVMTVERGHNKEAEGKGYNYNGKFKRYRVAQNRSKPGIIRSLNIESGAIEIEPVKEYYLNRELDRSNDFVLDKEPHWATLKNDEENYTRRRRGKPLIIDSLSEIEPEVGGPIKVTLHGEYEWGVSPEVKELQLMEKAHRYRFYSSDGGKEIGTVPTECFWPKEKLKRIVYLGNFQNEHPNVLWYQNLHSLKEGDFIYYEMFNGQITAIGKNFLFKALFNHEDAVPDAIKACKDETNLCPRCSLFGFVGEGGMTPLADVGIKARIGTSGEVRIGTVRQDSPAADQGVHSGDKLIAIDGKDTQGLSVNDVQSLLIGQSGAKLLLVVERQVAFERREFDLTCEEFLPQTSYKARFKSATLVNPLRLTPRPHHNSDGYPGITPSPVPLIEWVDESGEQKARQLLLPILSSPKPNKRDVKGYFNDQTGEILGAKVYSHFQPSRALERVPEKVVLDKKEVDYPQDQRRFAQVAVRGMQFEGTLGAENCSPTEIAALIVLLEKSIAHHAFKLGLGKSLGLGSVSSSIERVWIRSAENYRWQALTSLEALLSSREKIAEEIELLRKHTEAVNSNEDLAKSSTKDFYYPGPERYWQNANIRIARPKPE